MQQRNIHAFSLLELMVVIMIIGLLALAANPIYKSYISKSKFSEVFNNIAQYKDSLQAAYIDNDEFPYTLANLTVSTYTTTTLSGLTLLYYGRSTDKQSAFMHFFTQNLGIDGFAASATDGTGGASARLSIAAVSTSTGQMQFYCGQWDGSSADVPLSYLPKNCQDTNISALIS